MKLEEKYIIDLLKRNNNDTVLPQLNFGLLVDLLVKQKIFLYTYSILSNKKINYFQRKILEDKYNDLKIERMGYLKIFKKIIKILNNCNVKYYIYKGVPLEKLVYDDEFKRMYDDIDIIMESYDDIKYVKEKIKLFFENVQEYDEVYNDILGETKLTITINNELYIVEFKTEKHLLKVKEFSDSISLCIDGYRFNTFSLEITFLQLVSYYYEFTENIEMFRYLEKYLLKYPLDLYNYLKKYLNVLDWKKIELLSMQYAMVHKVRLAVLNISKLFNDRDILSLLKHFSVDKITYKYNGVIDKGSINWNIPLEQRFFNIKEITDFLVKYSLGEFWLENNKNLFDNKPIKICFNDNISYIYFYISQEDIVVDFFNNKMFDENIIIYVNIFGYRQSGTYIDPFIPICIRKINGEYLISGIEQSCRVKLNYESEKNLKLSNEFVLVKEEKNKLKIVIKILRFPHKFEINSLMALNVYLYKTKDNKVVETWNLNNYYEPPLRLK